jgi:hypothetical protein
METYSKIQTLYKRYKHLGDKCPNPKWHKFQNQIIMGCYSDPAFGYLKDCLFEGYSKIDGTNSKICYFPSTNQIMVGGKTDKASSQHGQFEMLQEIADRIKPELEKMFPKETARFAPVKNVETNKIQYYATEIEYATAFNPVVAFKKVDNESLSGLKNVGIELEEIPVYIYGEYFGQGIQKCGGRYFDKNDFQVFDIEVQGWWVPKDVRDAYCKGLGLKTVPFIGIGTLAEFEKMVTDGFTTKVEGVKDPTLIEEGIVARPTVPIKDERGNRIIVKIKHCDYNKWNSVRKEFTDEEFKEFNDWYNENIEPIY